MLGIGQRALLGIKNIGVEIAMKIKVGDLMDVPGKNPGVQERIAGVAQARSEVQGQGVGEDKGQGCEKAENQEAPFPVCHVSVVTNTNVIIKMTSRFGRRLGRPYIVTLFITFVLV